jgi:hypothetical protein
MPKAKGDLKNKNAKVKVKKIESIAKDKTFGMKNKNKSKVAQTLVKSIATGLEGGGGYEKLQAKIYEEKKRKKEMQEEAKMMGDVFGKVVPKNSGDKKICAFFKAGLCNKGKKCKFSHDTDVNGQEENKNVKIENEKIDLYIDQRDILFGNKDVIENWNQEKLSEVVNYNAMKYVNPKQTDKACKHFLEAVEKKTYGWLWMCPNGHDCIFSHCLPQGYVFKSDKKEEVKVETKDELIEKIDDEREKLSTLKLTPITQELFFGWLEKRKIQKDKERKERIEEDLKELGIKSTNKPTGRELFEKKAEIFKDADDAIDIYERDNHQNMEIDDEAFGEEEELPDF